MQNFASVYGSMFKVLNLIINGLPSIQSRLEHIDELIENSFKPYYKWITFNTIWNDGSRLQIIGVLNLIINGLPSIQYNNVLKDIEEIRSFKPYYKWITFNTQDEALVKEFRKVGFKPYYKWITFNT